MAYDNPKSPSLWGQAGVPPQANGRASIATSGGQGNVGVNLILEAGSGGTVLRADGATTSSNSLGFSTDYFDANGTKNFYGYSKDTSGTVEGGQVAYMTKNDLSGKQIYIGEDGVGGTVASLMASNGWSFPVYGKLVNGTDNVTVEGVTPQDFFNQRIDSSETTDTVGTLCIRIDGPAPQSNATQSLATTVPRGYLATLL